MSLWLGSIENPLMIYPSAKFDVDWSKETKVIIKKILMFDA